MAVCDASESLPKLQIEAVMSVRPVKVSEPRRVRRVLMSDTDSIVKTKGIHGCYQIVLYYESLKEEEGDKFLAGWIVESLGSALVEHPLLSGRLKKKDSDQDETVLEIVPNDSGIRLYEVRFPMLLSKFLSLRAEKEHLEAELVFWKEIDQHNPQFSPLFYVQVTHFECGGYTVGISCSLLLADALVVENFLKTWADIHNSMLLQREEIKAPIFHHSHLVKNDQPPPAEVINRTRCGKAQSMAFKFIGKDLNLNQEFWREVAMLCVEEAEQKLDKKVWTEFSLFVKEMCEVMKVEGHSKSGYCKKVLDQSLKNEISGGTWNDFGEFVMFHEGNKPVHVSRWIGSIADDGNVVVIPCPEEKASAVIIVSLP
ncbi:protein ECERIFERUM 2-like [Vigna unguiculata]|uniref:protein ECERIFERUM 2-like n=1 Tax=Vigna unguiculata TaxID=3917 RepID=UPI001016A013|nr:protein ECERIFERUM 2-like [Vigna unguiculata]